MKAWYKIAFTLQIFVFFVFFIGQDMVNGAVYEKDKIENTSNIAGSPSGSNQESSNDEDVTFYHQPCSRQIVTHECLILSMRTFGLPPAIWYPIWLPPDIS
jgi:hypothetical protein